MPPLHAAALQAVVICGAPNPILTLPLLALHPLGLQPHSLGPVPQPALRGWAACAAACDCMGWSDSSQQPGCYQLPGVALTGHASPAPLLPCTPLLLCLTFYLCRRLCGRGGGGSDLPLQAVRVRGGLDRLSGSGLQQLDVCACSSNCLDGPLIFFATHGSSTRVGLCLSSHQTYVQPHLQVKVCGSLYIRIALPTCGLKHAPSNRLPATLGGRR